ncbi:flagellar protein FlaG [Noviherbaspirillum massiliense]|uniref:flagellar protein FlaG n=1 Tax=Noviherbaspirillum massiliense TaxID=1465823 RepID=UPI0003139C79|nr:flagellar protein FlaG [Noviherbaspirillum massiliense]
MSISSINGYVPSEFAAEGSRIKSAPDAKPAASAAEPGSPAGVAPASPSRSDVIDAIKTLNKFVGTSSQGIQFSIDEETGKTVVKVVDSETKAVLRQMPSAEALSIARSIDKLRGLLIQQKA